MKTKNSREIATIDGVVWTLGLDGNIKGMEGDYIMYEFWIANPPTNNKGLLSVFSMICELALARGLLTSIRIYHLAQ